MAFKVEKNTYPNGDRYRSVYNGDLRIGSYNVVEAGYVPWGCRKVLASELDAQLRVIQRYVTEHLGLAAKAAQLYEEL